MSRPSKGKGKRLPSPSISSSEEDDHIVSQGKPPKRTRISSPQRIQAIVLARMANKSVSSSSKGMAGFASLVNRTSLSAAKVETNQGLKGGPSGRLALGHTSKNSKAAKTQETEGITVGMIVFLVTGITENMVDDAEDASLFYPIYCLQSDVDTSAIALTGMKQAGLCVMRDTGFHFLPTDTYSIIDEKLQPLFPKLYEWLSSNEDPQGTETSWLICMKPPYKKSLIVYSDDQTLPSGFDIMRTCMMSKSKAGLQDRILYLVTRNPVPFAVVQSWRPIIASCSRITQPQQPQSFETSEEDAKSAEETDEEVDTSSNPPPLPSILPLLERRRSLRHRSEEEVDNDIISISDDDNTPIALADVANSEIDPATDPATPPHVANINNSFASSMYFSGEDDPWN